MAVEAYLLFLSFTLANCGIHIKIIFIGVMIIKDPGECAEMIAVSHFVFSRMRFITFPQAYPLQSANKDSGRWANLPRSCCQVP